MNYKICVHISDSEVYYDVVPNKLHGQPDSEAVVPMAVVKTSDDRIEMTQNQVYGTVATHQHGDPVTAVDKIEMTQNQVYGTVAAHQDGGPVTAVDKIGMTQNQVYGTVAAHQDGGPVTAVDKIAMTQNQVYGTVAAHQDGDPVTAVDGQDRDGTEPSVWSAPGKWSWT